MQILFRPHHFLCALCFRGSGYTPAFVANFHIIMDTLNKIDGGSVSIKIVNHTDSICAPCPHRHGTMCATQERITMLDQAHANALRLQNKTAITWGEAKKTIQHNLTLNKFHEICAGCEWKQYGICENVLNQFLQSHSFKT